MNAAERRGLKPRYIKIDPRDNVAIVANQGGLEAGARFSDGLVLRDRIPQAHKLALRDIAEGEPILRYGQAIGYAARELPKGSWVEESAVALLPAPDLDGLPLPASRGASARTAPHSKAGGPLPLFFEGYRNPDGRAGSKNLLGLVPSVQCVAGILRHAAARIEGEILPKYPGVEGLAVLVHDYGCGVAIDAPDADIPIRTLRNLADHPNFGGEALVVGLGCEKLLPSRIAPRNSSDDIVNIQGEAGFAASVARIMRLAEERLGRLNERRREKIPLSELIVGLQCGGSDAFSGVTANPAIGYAADLLVEAGATVLFSEVTEVRDAVHLLVPRCAGPEVARALVREMRWYDEYLARGGADRSANPAPGNKEGGLSNVVEKALGSIAKSGTSPISSVLAPGERAAGKGLVFAATPASDFVCGTLQLASGIHLQVFSTGRGTPYGLAMAPVVKVSTNSPLAEKWPDLIDLDAGRIASGKSSVEEVGREIFELVIKAASGRIKVLADRHGLRNDLVLFNPAPVT